MKKSHTYTAIVITAVLLSIQGCGGPGGYGGGGGSSGGQVASITITPANSTIAVNGTQQYMATAKDSNGNTLSGVTYTWTSSSNSVATVNANGLATGVAAGTTMITASVTYSGGIYGMGTTITSNSATLTVTAAGMAMGMVATGRAVQGAMVSLEDAHGQIQVAMSDANGRYVMPVAGLTPPFLFKATDNQGHALFSSGTGEGVINIDPLTDLMTRIWYRSRGITAEAAFTDIAAHPAPEEKTHAALNRALVNLLADAFTSQNLDATKFDLVSTPFIANSTGFDRILDNTSVSMSGGQMLLRDALADTETEIAFSGNSITFNTVSHMHTQPHLTRTLLLLP